jgi:FHS family L-fucose permease-like MFS transporter
MESNFKSKKNRLAFVVVTALFFMWGFITCMNDILIPYLKMMFNLSYFQGMLVNFAFFGAYFIGSLAYFIISSTKGDPILRIGYKKGIIAGLLISGTALTIFYPAALLHSYGLFLSALFILGLGFTLLQITANPYVAILGSDDTASSRLNLSQGFNSLGTTIAPIIGGYLVFHYFAQYGQPLLNEIGEKITTADGTQVTAFAVQAPYLIFAAVFFIIALIVYRTELPKVTDSDEMEFSAGALRYRNLVLGMVAIFMYVGAEVSIGSIMINYIQEQLDIGEMIAKSYLAFYWGGAMIGRFMGAISMSSTNQSMRKNLYMIATSFGVFSLIYVIVYIESGFVFPFQNVLPFAGFLVLNFIAFRIGKGLPHQTLFIFALVNVALLAVALYFSGLVSMWAIVAIGLFNSIMWSNIFTLAIRGLGKYTSQGSSLLVMMILGGALIPLVQGAVADSVSLHMSFIVPVFSYIYLAFYGKEGYKPIKWNSKVSENE